MKFRLLDILMIMLTLTWTLAFAIRDNVSMTLVGMLLLYKIWPHIK